LRENGNGKEKSIVIGLGDLAREIPFPEMSVKAKKEFIHALIATISKMLAEGKAVRLADFGTFVPQLLPARKGKIGGKEVEIPARRQVRFRLAKKLKEV